MDGVQKANSGHPGMPMGMAELAAVLWADFLVVDPEDPTWPDRDRFVLSNGHGSMLLYSLLHLSGFPMSMDDLRKLPAVGLPHRRPSGARPTPGNRDHDRTTRPGIRNGRWYGHRREPPSQPARLRTGRSLNLRLRLGRRPHGRHLGRGFVDRWSSRPGAAVYVYDDNDISIDGSTDITFTEDVLETLRGRRLARARNRRP